SVVQPMLGTSAGPVLVFERLGDREGVSSIATRLPAAAGDPVFKEIRPDPEGIPHCRVRPGAAGPPPPHASHAAHGTRKEPLRRTCHPAGLRLAPPSEGSDGSGSAR